MTRKVLLLTLLITSAVCTVTLFDDPLKGSNNGQTKLAYLVDPGSGTGGVGVTSINGVQLPTAISSSQIAMTGSAMGYNEVTHTINWSLTLKNISSGPIRGPLQIVFFGLPPQVTLANATRNLFGTPYLTVPALESLRSGQSVIVSVQFRNPSKSRLQFTPAIYSGSIK
jgi:hypothetical protein